MTQHGKWNLRLTDLPTTYRSYRADNTVSMKDSVSSSACTTAMSHSQIPRADFLDPERNKFELLS